MFRYTLLAAALIVSTHAIAKEAPKEGERGTMELAAMGHPSPYVFQKASLRRGFVGVKEANEYQEMHAFVYIRPGTDVLVERAPGGNIACVRPDGAKECLWVESEKVGPLYVADPKPPSEAPLLSDAEIEALDREAALSR